MKMQILSIPFKKANLQLLIMISLLLILITGKIRIYTVLSGSMEPSIPVGSLVFVSRGFRNPKAGDVLTFRQGSTIITHRIVGIETDSYRTKGDANSSEDYLPVSENQVIGTVFFCLPLAGYPILAIRSFFGIPLLSVLSMCFILIAIHSRSQASHI